MLEQGFVIIEPYKLKGNIIFDKNDMHWLFQMKQAVHDNINSFVGVSIDRNVDFYVIWKHCLRGTLSDVIKNSGIGNNPKFDRDFKGAFVRDLIKGLDYIHASSIGYHGGLTSTQCLIDGHWILKISGFGISKMFFKWHHNRMLDGCDGNQVIPNSGNVSKGSSPSIILPRTPLLCAGSQTCHQILASDKQTRKPGLQQQGRSST